MAHNGDLSGGNNSPVGVAQPDAACCGNRSPTELLMSAENGRNSHQGAT